MTIDKLWEDYSSFTSLNEGHYDYLIDKTDFKECMLQFAKYHITKALKQATINANEDLKSQSIWLNNNFIFIYLLFN